MSVNIQPKTNYSQLFSGLNQSGNTGMFGNMSWLSDYSSIKSGSYSKLMKAYYSSDISEEKSNKLKDTFSTKLDTDTKAYSKASTDANAVTGALSDLGALADDADEDAVYKAVSNYVKSYNSLVDSVSATGDKSLDNRLGTIENYTKSNEKQLNAIGITIKADNTLELNKDTLASADRNDVNALFANRNSYAYGVKVSASMIESNANYNASKDSTYTSAGTYSSVVGSLWDTTT